MVEMNGCGNGIRRICSNRKRIPLFLSAFKIDITDIQPVKRCSFNGCNAVGNNNRCKILCIAESIFADCCYAVGNVIDFIRLVCGITNKLLVILTEKDSVSACS